MPGAKARNTTSGVWASVGSCLKWEPLLAILGGGMGSGGIRLWALQPRALCCCVHIFRW